MFTLAQLAQILSADCQVNLNPAQSTELVKGFSTDTRFINEGEVFLALKGENFDGHRFVENAINRGASAVIVQEPVSFSPSTAYFQVKDTLAAYQKIAHSWRKKQTIPVIAITGSVGKTTTKELVAAVCSRAGRVCKTELNYNNEIGVPKTLLGITASDNYAVIEMGMRAKGEIALLAQITAPDLAIITNVGTAHIGRLGSVEAIARAKCELLEHLDPSQGIAILNQDNPLLISTAKEVWSGQTITYGLKGGDLKGELIDNQTMRVNGQDFLLPIAGEHNAANYLAALAVAKVLGIDWNKLSQGIPLDLPQGRSALYKLENDIQLLDETYNAGLESMLAALNLLKQTSGKRHIAVLGAMKELGEYTESFHQKVGQRVKELGLDQLYVLSSDAEALSILNGATGVKAFSCSTKQELISTLKSNIIPGDRILFKASHSVGLDQAVESLRSQQL